MLSAEYLLATAVVVALPGTGVLYTVATGAAAGFRAGAFAAFGCTLGILPAIGAAYLGLSALLHAGALAYAALRWAGAAYLLYLAWTTWRDRGPIRFGQAEPAPGWRIARTGALINVLNPKLSVFFLAFLPQFLDPALPLGPQLASMSGAFMALTFAGFLLYAALASYAGAALRRPAVATAVRRLTAAAFPGFGLRLAAER